MGNIDMKACCYKDVKVGVRGYGYGPVTESVDRNMNEVPQRQKMFLKNWINNISSRTACIH
jgi:hypothetical protein